MPIREIAVDHLSLQEQCLLLLNSLTREETNVTEEDISNWSEEECEAWLEAWDEWLKWN